jgi:hypothetical protein
MEAVYSFETMSVYQSTDCQHRVQQDHISASRYRCLHNFLHSSRNSARNRYHTFICKSLACNQAANCTDHKDQLIFKSIHFVYNPEFRINKFKLSATVSQSYRSTHITH